MNVLLFGDLHIKKEELIECSLVLDEILELSKENKIDKIINLGDSFDIIKPNSLELDLFSNFITKLNKPIIILSAQSHESTTTTESILNHFEILHPNVTVMKKYMDDVHMFCGHFVLHESKLSYGAKLGKKDFRQYRYVFLGHQHNYEIIKPNICHLGSCRSIDFAESEDNSKNVCIIEDYKGKDEKVRFLTLKSPYPMIDAYLDTKVATAKDLKGKTQYFKAISELKSYLDALDPKTKVRVIFKDFEGYSDFRNDYSTYKNKFILFKDRKDFVINNNLIVAKVENISLKENLEKYLNDNKVNEEIKDILMEELK